MRYQITFDALDPHRLVRFWAALMGLEVEVDSAFVQRMVAEGHADESETIEIDGDTHWRTAAACSSPDRSTRLLFQLDEHPTQGKNRVHLDLDVGADDRDAEVERAIGLGATRLWEASQGPLSWVTLADPEGNEFCIA